AWQPEFAVDLVEASGYGTTVVAAAATRTAELAVAATSLAEVTAIAERCLLAALAEAFPAVLQALRDRAALDVEVAHLMDALPALARTLPYAHLRGPDVSPARGATAAAPALQVAHLTDPLPALARTLRYGDVRGTDVSSVRAVTHGLAVRICVGLPAAVAALDDDAAAAMRRYLDGLHAALARLGHR